MKHATLYATTIGLMLGVAAVFWSLLPVQGEMQQPPIRTPALRCHVDVLDSQGHPVHRLCDDGRGQWFDGHAWLDVGPVTRIPAVPAR